MNYSSTREIVLPMLLGNKVVLVLDDDPSIFRAIQRMGKVNGTTALHFGNVDELAAWVEAGAHDALIRDACSLCFVMDAMYIEDFGQNEILANLLRYPRICIGRSVSVSATLSSIRTGLFALIERPFSLSHMQSLLDQAFEYVTGAGHHYARVENVHRRFEQLTPRESEVSGLVVNGYPNKEISELLCISIKTVKVHRSNMMRKLGVKSVIELIRTYDVYASRDVATKAAPDRALTFSKEFIARSLNY